MLFIHSSLFLLTNRRETGNVFLFLFFLSLCISKSFPIFPHYFLFFSSLLFETCASKIKFKIDFFDKFQKSLLKSILILILFCIGIIIKFVNRILSIYQNTYESLHINNHFKSKSRFELYNMNKTLYFVK